MPLNLNKPFNDQAQGVDEKATLADLQANILKGHGREHTAHIFLTFEAAKAIEIKAWIKKLAPKVTTAASQLSETADRKAFLAKEAKKGTNKAFDSQPIVLFFLSASGYAKLGIAAAKQPGDTVAWGAGLKSRQGILTDPIETDWEPDYQGKIDAMVLLADTTAEKVESQVKAFRGAAKKDLVKAVTIKHVELGKAWRNENGDGIEHFGYVDGRSQPLLLESEIQNQKLKKDGISVWDPTFHVGLALVKDPAGASANSFGSYLVFRKLEQNVLKFKALEDDLAKLLKLEGEDEERAGALIVGRFEDGTPISLQHSPGMKHDVPNNFDFKDDPEGTKCPFHSHIRKTNPRGDSSLTFGVALEEERAHLMARRGITYGERRFFTSGKGVEFKDLPTGDVGLLFMAYQNDIQNQFEFTQASWANQQNFVKPNTGIDPVIGQGPSGGQGCPMHWGGKKSENKFEEFDFRNAVTMKGGEYFFAPSISGLKNL